MCTWFIIFIKEWWHCLPFLEECRNFKLDLLHWSVGYRILLLPTGLHLNVKRFCCFPFWGDRFLNIVGQALSRLWGWNRSSTNKASLLHISWPFYSRTRRKRAEIFRCARKYHPERGAVRNWMKWCEGAPGEGPRQLLSIRWQDLSDHKEGSGIPGTRGS